MLNAHALVISELPILGNLNKIRYTIIIQIGDGVRHNRLGRLMTPTNVQINHISATSRGHFIAE